MFQSFFLAGFECTVAINRYGKKIDQIAATAHDERAHEDYRNVTGVGAKGSRDGVRWPLVDKGGGTYDFRSVLPQLEAANRVQCDVIWDLFHFGFPDGVHPLDPQFPQRFADYCRATARFLKSRYWGQLFFTPCNEPSFLSWAAGEVGLFWPHLSGKGFEMKTALAKAAIKGIEALWEEAPGCRIVNVDPICRVVPPKERPELENDARYFNSKAVYESWDMLCGNLLPELGGTRKHLDIVGINYYHTNQWEIGSTNGPLPADDPRRVPLENLILDVHRRYQGEVMITETADSGDQRPEWIREVDRQCRRAKKAGVSLLGVCLYPILGMPEWHEPEVWTHMGVWDLEPQRLDRVPHEPSIEAMQEVLITAEPVEALTSVEKVPE